MLVFIYSNYLSSRQKSEKTNKPVLRKMLTNRQTDNGDFIGPFVGWGPNIKITLSFR